MGKKIRLTTTLLIAMDSKGTRVTSLLPYDNNMLYLPLDKLSTPGAGGGSVRQLSIDSTNIRERSCMSASTSARSTATSLSAVGGSSSLLAVAITSSPTIRVFILRPVCGVMDSPRGMSFSRFSPSGVIS